MAGTRVPIFGPSGQTTEFYCSPSILKAVTPATPRRVRRHAGPAVPASEFGARTLTFSASREPAAQPLTPSGRP